MCWAVLTYGQVGATWPLLSQAGPQPEPLAKGDLQLGPRRHQEEGCLRHTSSGIVGRAFPG